MGTGEATMGTGEATMGTGHPRDPCYTPARSGFARAVT